MGKAVLQSATCFHKIILVLLLLQTEESEERSREICGEPVAVICIGHDGLKKAEVVRSKKTLGIVGRMN